MKFYIFKKGELFGKLFIYVVIMGLTGALMKYYFSISDESGIFSFVVSISYALLLFVVTIIFGKIDKYTDEKLYEREGYFLTLIRLREVTNATIQKIDVNDVVNVRNNICSFQLFTGRDSEAIEKRAKGEKTPIYVRENGFEYTSKMLRLETEYLNLYEQAEKKELLKKSKEITKYYRKCCGRLEKNYTLLMQVYGGTLQNLVERDNDTSNTEFSLNDINSKIDNLIYEISSLREELSETTNGFDRSQHYIYDFCDNLSEKLSGVEMAVLDLSEDNMLK